MPAIIDGSVGSQFPTTIGVGNATPSTSGAGITFPATQSASSDANTLDDYEEGTWTPTLNGSTTSPTVTYTIRIGVYTKIGRVVYFAFRVLTSAYSGGSGSLQITGLPFAASSGGGDITQFNCNSYFSDGINYGTSRTVLNPYVTSANILFRGLQNNATNYDLLVGDYASGEYLDVSGFYFV